MSVNLKKTKGWGDLSSEELLSACLQEGIVLDTAKKLVSNGIDGGVFLTLTEGDFLELPFNFGERKKLQSLISMAVKEVSAKSQGFFYPYSLYSCPGREKNPTRPRMNAQGLEQSRWANFFKF